MSLPEPLLDFVAAASAFSERLSRLHAMRDRVRDMPRESPISANTIEARRVELTYHSNAIEGNTLSLRETQLIVEGVTPDSSRPMREIYEARNHDRAIRMVESLAQSRGPGVLFSEPELLAIHECVLRDIDTPAAGRYRSGRVLIAGTRHVPPGPHRFAELIPTMLRLAERGGVDPVVRAAELHYNFVAVHPFNDGNGRTGRLIMNYVLISHGYPFAIIEIAQRKSYLSALDEANAGRAAPLLELVIECIERAFEQLGFSHD